MMEPRRGHEPPSALHPFHRATPPRRGLPPAAAFTLALGLAACSGGGAGNMPPPPPGHMPCTACGLLWSSPDTWPGGRVPVAGDDVTIPLGAQVVLDVDPPPLGGLTIEGELILDDSRDVALTADWILVRGAFLAGTAERPFAHRATITLTADDPDESVGGMGTRALLVVGGNLALHGVAPEVIWTKLADHAEAGAGSLTLADAVDWREGDEVVVAPTDYYGVAESERLRVGGVDGATVRVEPPLAGFRWGRLQYATTSGMSLEDVDRVTPAAEPTPTVLDERAEVASLTRNIVIQGVDDALWREQGFGAHVMIMMLSSEVVLDGVELRRVGQRGRLARYPLHWHLQSYPEDVDLGDANDVVRRSTIHDSSQRCIVIHGTNGVTVADNVCYDIEGHAIFLEDAVERRNTIERNLVMKVRNPRAPMLAHEGNVFQGGSSGFWLTNPDNVVRGNVAVDAEGVGFWLSFPPAPLGPSRRVALVPDHTRFGVFEDNVAHSNQKLGLNLDWVPVDDDGNVTPNSYRPTADMVTGRFDNWERCALRRFTTYKHREGGMWNRVVFPDYEEWVSADNVSTFFAGAGEDGLISRSLLVGTSLNARTPYPAPETPPVAFASYHSTFDMRQNVVVEFPFVPGVPSGAFRTDDYYFRPVDKGYVRNPDNLLVNAHPGYRVPRPSPSFALAGALWDPHGYFGPAGRYWTYDDPFLTAETSCAPVEPAGENGASCEGPYFGVTELVLDLANDRYAASMPLDVERQARDTGATVGRWVVEDGALVDAFQHFRHFAAHQGGRYVLRFPASRLPEDVGMTLENLHSREDRFLLGVQRTGASPARVYTTTTWGWDRVADAPSGPTKEIYREVSSLAEALASDGGVFYQDAAQDLVWVMVRGGLEPAFVETMTPTADERLYEAMHLRVH